MKIVAAVCSATAASSLPHCGLQGTKDGCGSSGGSRCSLFPLLFPIVVCFVFDIYFIVLESTTSTQFVSAVEPSKPKIGLQHDDVPWKPPRNHRLEQGLQTHMHTHTRTRARLLVTFFLQFGTHVTFTQVVLKKKD